MPMCAAMKHVGQLAGLFSSRLLDGVASPELVQHGYTTDEERAASGLSQVQPGNFSHALHNITSWPEQGTLATSC